MPRGEGGYSDRGESDGICLCDGDGGGVAARGLIVRRSCGIPLAPRHCTLGLGARPAASLMSHEHVKSVAPVSLKW